jgi:hypothetical protein
MHYLYLDQAFSSEELIKKTGLQNLQGIDLEILQEYNIVPIESVIVDSPNDPWTILSGPTYDKKKKKAVYKHEYIPLNDAKQLATLKLKQQANCACKECQYDLELDPLLVNSLDPNSPALGPLKQHLDTIAKNLDSALNAINNAQSTQDVADIVDSTNLHEH